MQPSVFLTMLGVILILLGYYAPLPEKTQTLLMSLGTGFFCTGLALSIQIGRRRDSRADKRASLAAI